MDEGCSLSPWERVRVREISKYDSCSPDTFAVVLEVRKEVTQPNQTEKLDVRIS
jgi:hypothetical protein